MNDTKQSFHVLRSATSLAKPEEATYFKGDEVVKYFFDKERVKGKVERANLLKGVVPELTRVGENFFAYKYVAGDLLSNADSDTFRRFLDFMKAKVWQPVSHNDSDFKDACRRFYYDKTYSRLTQFLKQTGIQDKKIAINGIEIPSANDLLEDIDWTWICDGISVLYHGDPQPENVLVTKDGFTLLDWREDFGGLRECGDIYYDLAKVYHALWVSGEIIRQGRFTIHLDPVEYTIAFRDNLMAFKDILEEFILERGYDLRKVKVLSAIIYLNIASLHQDPYNRFLFYFGRKYLAEVI